jgi:hypothetical protein
MVNTDLKNKLHANGWVLVKSIFSEKEIDDIREKVYKSQNSGHKGDILSNPLLHEIVFDKRVLDILRELTADQLIYFGDSSYLVDNKSHGFHKDNPDRNDPTAPDWYGDYSVLRVGIYLQDHTHSSGGLLLRDKSHKLFSISEGRGFNVPIQKGDVVVWYLKTTHSGNARLFKLFNSLIINPKYYKFVPRFLFLTEKAKRIGIFLSYGEKSSHLSRYLDYLKTRKYSVSNWQNSVYDPKVLAEAEERGLKVIDMRPLALKIPVDSLNEFHADIPY